MEVKYRAEYDSQVFLAEHLGECRCVVCCNEMRVTEKVARAVGRREDCFGFINFE